VRMRAIGIWRSNGPEPSPMLDARPGRDLIDETVGQTQNSPVVTKQHGHHTPRRVRPHIHLYDASYDERHTGQDDELLEPDGELRMGMSQRNGLSAVGQLG